LGLRSLGAWHGSPRDGHVAMMTSSDVVTGRDRGSVAATGAGDAGIRCLVEVDDDGGQRGGELFQGGSGFSVPYSFNDDPSSGFQAAWSS